MHQLQNLLTVSLVLFLHFFFMLCSADAQSCEGELELVSEYFDEANLDTSRYGAIIKLLKDCEPDKFDLLQHQIRAYEFLIAAYWESKPEENKDKAMSEVIKLLDLLENNYEPNKFMFRDNELIAEVKKRIRKRKGAYKKWLWIGGGAVASAVSAFFIFKPGSRERLAGPPPLPGN